MSAIMSIITAAISKFPVPRHHRVCFRHLFTTKQFKFCAEKPTITSFLYIPGDVANKIVSLLKPAVTMETSAADASMDAIQRSIQARCMQPVDLGALQADWHRLQKLTAELNDLKTAAAEKSTDDAEANGGGGDVKRQKQSDGRLYELSKTRNHVEKAVIPRMLQLPNRLNDRTPLDDNAVVNTVIGAVPRFGFEAASHQCLGQRTKTIIWTKAGLNAFYFTGVLAWLERAIGDYLKQHFVQKGFVTLSNPALIKPIVAEGCGVDFSNPNAVFHMERSHDGNVYAPVDTLLTGSASVAAFCAFHTKTRVRQADLPVRFCTTGTCYMPLRRANADAVDEGLLSVAQASAVSFFVAAESEECALQEYDGCLAMVVSAFAELGIHFRVAVMPAKQLVPSESLRTEIQMWLPSLSAYVAVASLSLYGDYVSRRLLMMYRKREDKSMHFLHVVHGNAVSIPQFVACLMENTQTAAGDFELPQKLKDCIDRLR